MGSTQHNFLLTKVNSTLRRGRKKISEDLNYTIWSGPGEEDIYAFIWFRTRGCRFDYRGECTMCDYWISTQPSADQMVASVQQALASFAIPPRILLVTPSGSMFDEWEVPRKARLGVFQLVRDFPCEKYICETRPEFVTADALEEMARVVTNKSVSIEMGLESADPWILKYCINKSIDLSVFRNAISLAHQYNVTTTSNVLLGSPFLTEREAIEDAVKTVKWSFEMENDHCIVFPAHVKPWTLLHWLWEHQMYSTPSLWSLVEVLRRLGPNLSPRVFISWYRPQYGEEHLAQGKLSAQFPSTCSNCRDVVLEYLDRYRRYEGFDAIEYLSRYQCKCKDAWYKAIEAEPDTTLQDRVKEYYHALSKQILNMPLSTFPVI